MKMSKKIALIMFMACLPVLSIADGHANFLYVTGYPAMLLTPLFIPMLLIGLPLHFAPSLVGWNACAKRKKLLDKVAAFKMTLNKKQLADFKQAFQPYDTWAVTKAPFCTQIANIVTPLPSSLMWLTAAGLAGTAQYLEYCNEEQFDKAVETIQFMDATSSK